VISNPPQKVKAAQLVMVSDLTGVTKKDRTYNTGLTKESFYIQASIAVCFWGRNNGKDR
jgi:hypothetical protein